MAMNDQPPIDKQALAGAIIVLLFIAVGLFANICPTCIPWMN